MRIPRVLPSSIAALIVGVVGLGGLVGCGSDDDEAALVALTDTPASAERAAEIEDLARRVVDDSGGEIPAVWVGVWDEAEGAHTFAYGEAAPGREATSDDVWRIGSITKTFTATVALQLIDEGELALTDTVAEVHPDLAARFPEYASITVNQLLRMRSGIDDFLNSPRGIVSDIVDDPQRIWETDELIAGGIAVGVEAAGTPGYSTTNYIVLQEIVEKLTGSTLRDEIESRVAEPLALDETVLPPADDSSLSEPATSGTVASACSAELRSDGADVAVGTDTTDWSVSSAQGGGAMQSTLSELGVWAASTSGSALLSEETARLREQTDLIAGGVDYGLGLMRFGDFLGHEGEELGWEALALHDPVKGRTLVIATNACGTGLQIFGLADALYPDAGVFASLLASP